jgi:hypothetical protein
MKTRTKTFDCIEEKNRIQAELRREYEARKDEFSCYAEFINATAEESEEIRAYWARVAAAKKAAKF